MKTFAGKLAVITGAGTGMGRELAIQLASEGCHIAICDVSVEEMEKTSAACRDIAPGDIRVSSHVCDVSSETDVLAFRDGVLSEHATNHINLLFNNAGIGGGGSFIEDARDDWERTFGVCWYGVYYCSRAFVPLLVASSEGCIVNTSSVNGFWASLGPMTPHTAYSAAKFAVKGFTEALLTDMRINAPHVQVALVMPGHVGTSISSNTRKVLGKPAPKDMMTEELEAVRQRMARAGMPADSLTDDQLRAAIEQRDTEFRDKAPMSAGQAASVILDGVREGSWRILVGDDARVLDRFVRSDPEEAYELDFVERLANSGHLAGTSPTSDDSGDSNP